MEYKYKKGDIVKVKYQNKVEQIKITYQSEYIGVSINGKVSESKPCYFGKNKDGKEIMFEEYKVIDVVRIYKQRTKQISKPKKPRKVRL